MTTKRDIPECESMHRANFEKMEARRASSTPRTVALEALREIERIAHPESKTFEIAATALMRIGRYEADEQVIRA